MKEDKLQLFQDQTIRSHWDEEQEKWYFSIVDVVSILTEQKDYKGGRNYWKVLKHRLTKEGSELVANCNQHGLAENKDTARKGRNIARKA